MVGTDWKQLPNLEQVFVVALLPLLFVALGLLGLIIVLWWKNIFIRRRIASLEADIKTIHDKSRERFGSLEADIKTIHEKIRRE